MGRIEDIEAELQKTRDHQASLVAEWNTLKGQSLDERMGELFGDGDITLETAMQVDLGECGNTQYGSTWWKMVSEFLEGLTFGGVLEGLYQTGINPDVGGQALFSIKLDQNMPLADQQGLKVILPLVTAVDGWKRFDIFEHTCSAGGSWLLRISEDGEVAEVLESRNYRYKVEHGSTAAYHAAEFVGSVDDARAYIYKTHPYELLKGSRDDYDDEHDEDDEW